MKVYRTDEIRNVVLLGHGGAGKTTIVEALAYISGITTRPGKVTDGNTISDFDKEEQKRKISLSLVIFLFTRLFIIMRALLITLLQAQCIPAYHVVLDFPALCHVLFFALMLQKHVAM